MYSYRACQTAYEMFIHIKYSNWQSQVGPFDAFAVLLFSFFFLLLLQLAACCLCCCYYCAPCTHCRCCCLLLAWHSLAFCAICALYFVVVVFYLYFTFTIESWPHVIPKQNSDSSSTSSSHSSYSRQSITSSYI